VPVEKIKRIKLFVVRYRLAECVDICETDFVRGGG
jgi:hypothetical protein